MQAAQLCEHCRQIKFDNLRYPTASEMADLQRGVGREMLFVKYFDPKVNDKKINLGRPSRIQQDSPHCRLCHLIWRTLIRYNGPEILDFTQDGNEVTCHVDRTYYGLFWHPRDEGQYHVVVRLSILTKVADRSTDTSIRFAFQTCNPGALSVQVDDNFQDPRADVDRLFFGGRRRPLDINLQWLRRWIEICQEEHGKNCEINQSQDELRYVPVDNNNLLPHTTPTRGLTLRPIGSKSFDFSILKEIRSHVSLTFRWEASSTWL
jgi:hypothetical protein